MNIWLCPVKPRSWSIIKKEKVFGAPTRAAKTMRLLKPGDLLIFHVFKPINGIVAVCQVTSEVYEDYHDIWGKKRYPLRVKIEFSLNLLTLESNPIPLSHILGRTANNEIEIEPYLRSIWVTRVSIEQYKRLADSFGNHQRHQGN